MNEQTIKEIVEGKKKPCNTCKSPKPRTEEFYYRQSNGILLGICRACKAIKQRRYQEIKDSKKLVFPVDKDAHKGYLSSWFKIGGKIDDSRVNQVEQRLKLKYHEGISH